MRPTDIAKVNFDMAFTFAQGENPNLQDVIMVLNQLAQGLGAMNTGLRATYMKLEDIHGVR